MLMCLKFPYFSLLPFCKYHIYVEEFIHKVALTTFFDIIFNIYIYVYTHIYNEGVSTIHDAFISLNLVVFNARKNVKLFIVQWECEELCEKGI